MPVFGGVQLVGADACHNVVKPLQMQSEMWKFRLRESVLRHDSARHVDQRISISGRDAADVVARSRLIAVAYLVSPAARAALRPASRPSRHFRH